MKIVLALLVWFISIEASATYRGRLSIEETLDPLNAILQNATKARVEKEFNPYFFAYVLAGNEGSTRPDSPLIFRPGAHLYAGPGVKTAYANITLTGDVRFRKYHLVETYAGAPELATVDAQVMLAYDNYWDATLLDSPYVGRFAEAYTETVFTSADNSNIVHNTFVRGGAELTVATGAYLAAYVEPSVFLDRIGHYYNNRAEVRFAGRFRYQWSGVELNLTAYYLVNHYFDIQLFETSPPPALDKGFGAKLFMALKV